MKKKSQPLNTTPADFVRIENEKHEIKLWKLFITIELNINVSLA